MLVSLWRLHRVNHWFSSADTQTPNAGHDDELLNTICKSMSKKTRGFWVSTYIVMSVQRFIFQNSKVWDQAGMERPK